MVLKDVIRVLGQDGRRTNADLYNAIARSNLDAMHALLAGTAGATYVDPKTERTGMSLKMTIQNQLESFRFLPDTGEPFSIREWVQNDSESWMFITAREELREALKPVLSLWIDTAIKAVLGLEPTHKERLWFFIDELPTLQKLDILKLALTNTRKYGLCMVIGIQDFSQLNEIYGQHQARTIISGCQTKLLLRVTDGEAARLLAKLMGEAELDEKEETLSYGLSSSRDGVSVFARRNLRDIVLTSEVLTLPDMHGYMTIPGDYPVAKVAYQYEATPTISEGFIERAGFGINFGVGSPLSLMPRPTTQAGDDEDYDTGPDEGGPVNPPSPPSATAAAAATSHALAAKPKPAKKKGAMARKDKPFEPVEPPLFGEDFPEPEDPVIHFNEIDADDRIVEMDRETGETLDASAELSLAKVDAVPDADASPEPPNTGRGAAGMLSIGKRAE
jgi:hypothetical protein